MFVSERLSLSLNPFQRKYFRIILIGKLIVKKIKLLHFLVGVLVAYGANGFTLSAQTRTSLYMVDYRLDSLKKKELRLEIDNMFFFKDNEFESSVLKGYTLPGLWVNPKLAYMPTSNLKFEAGAYMLMYSGAYKYPNYAYQDIAKWKGGHYQNGAHILPFFRGQLALGRFNIVMGNLYGGSNHHLILPLYNPELDFTADPESGIQFLYDAPRFHLDAWVNWQSFIFETDTHQEAFIAGITSEILFNSSKSRWHWYMPVQFVAQHRGGEQDDTSNVETFMNGAIGLGLTWNVNGSKLRRINWEVDALGYYQQAGELWPFDSGLGWYTKAGFDFRYLSLHAGAFTCKEFISLLGSPFFGAVSTKHKGGYYEGHPYTAFLSMEYLRTSSKHYSFSINGDVYYSVPGKLVLEDGSTRKDQSKNICFSIGAYLNFDLSFLLKKF